MPVIEAIEPQTTNQTLTPSKAYLTPELLGAVRHEFPAAWAAINLDTSALKDKNDLQRFIRFRRAVVGKTQREVAERIGVYSPEYLGMVENEKRMVEASKWPALADALEVNRVEMVKLYLKVMIPEIYAAIWGMEKIDLSLAQEATSNVELPDSSVTLVNLFNRLPQTQRTMIESMVKGMLKR